MTAADQSAAKRDTGIQGIHLKKAPTASEIQTERERDALVSEI